MHAEQLYVITPVSNPLRTRSRVSLTKAYCARMVASGVKLILVEAALGARPFEFADEPGITHVGVKYSTIVWHKESLINIGLSHLPRSADYVAWIDGDITFRWPTWAVDTVHALQQYSIVQPWEHAYDLGPHGEHLELHTSFASLYAQGKTVHPVWRHGYQFGHCLPADSLVVPGGRVLAASARPYKGEIVVLRTAAGKEISCTPNHPVLSGSDWIAAKDIDVGDYLVGHIRGNGVVGKPDEKHIPARIEDVARSFSEMGGRIDRSARSLPDDFDDFVGDSKVSTIWTDRLLRDERNPTDAKQIGDFLFGGVVDFSGAFAGSRSHDLLLNRLNASPPSSLSATSPTDPDTLFGSLFGHHASTDALRNLGTIRLSPALPEGERSSATRLTRKSERGHLLTDGFRDLFGNNSPSVAKFHADNPGTLLRGLSGQIESDQVVYVGRREFDGQVYDLQTEHGYIIADGLLTHNSGYAWAARREVLAPIGGLFDAAPLGSSDHHMAYAMINRVQDTIPLGISPQYNEALMAWQAKAVTFGGYRVGYISGTIEHGFHGPKAARNYVSRWDILKRWKFNPVTDLKYNLDRVTELTGQKIGLQRDIEAYFAARDEDSNQPR